jgi:hypothetical protein
VGSTFLGAPSQAAVLALGLSLVTMTLPAAWIGASFQLLLPHMAEEAIARGAAQVAGAGTAGAVLDASIGAVALVPLFGAERALALVTLGFAASAAFLGWRGRARKSTLATAVVTLAAVVLAPRWDTARLAFGAGLPAPPAWTREDAGHGLAATSPGGDFGANGRRIAVTAADQRTALLATLLAPRVGRAIVADDPAAAAALARLSWSAVAATPIPPSWAERLPVALRDARVAPLAAGLMHAPFPADAAIVAIPPACGEACASALAADARRAIAPDGVALFVIHGTPESLPAPEATRAVEIAARAFFAQVARAAASERAIVLAGATPFSAPPGRLEALPDGTEARAALASLGR